MKIIDAVWQDEATSSLFSQRDLYAMYDLQRHRAVKDRGSEELMPSISNAILSGLYGSPHSDAGRHLLRQSLSLFAANYEQLMTVEYFMLVQIYARVFLQAATQSTMQVKVKLPKFTEVV